MMNESRYDRRPKPMKFGRVNIDQELKPIYER